MPSSFPTALEVSIKKHWTDYIKSTGVLLLILFIFGSGFFGGEQKSWLETVYYDEQILSRDFSEISLTATKVGLVFLSGIIVSDASAGSSTLLSDDFLITPSRVAVAIKDLEKQHKDMKAILFFISSPGGEVGASDEIAHTMEKTREKYPIFVFTPDILASGGYYISAPATKIYAQPQADVGSIGVMAQLPNVQSLTDRYGFQMETYTTGELKDFGNPFRKRTDKEKALIQDMLNEAFLAFKTVVIKGRNFAKAELDKLATGETWTGKQAFEKKLIDAVVYTDEVSEQIKKELAVQEVFYVEVLPPLSFFDQLFSSFKTAQKEPVSTAVRNITPLLKKGVYYLWQGI